EPGSVGEPLYLDVIAALDEYAAESGAKFGGRTPSIIGGRYGLSSKEFTPAMVASIFLELAKKEPKRHFTVGIHDDVTKLSLEWDPEFSTEDSETYRAVFYGLGSDGTVSANKNSIKIIAEGTDLHSQGFFVYDSKKAGSTTTSHLRFGPKPITSTYLITRANFVACHQDRFLETVDILARAQTGATFLLNTKQPKEDIWDSLPIEVQKEMIKKKLRFFIVDAYRVAAEAGLGVRINTVMQTCFFKLADIIPDAAEKIKDAVRTTYGKKAAGIVEKNNKAIDEALSHLHEVKVPAEADSTIMRPPAVPEDSPDFVKRVSAKIIAGRGDLLPVSAFPVDGVYPVGTTQWEKRNLAVTIPIWEAELCIQCNKCAIVCPHAAIRVKAYPQGALSKAPEGFKHLAWKGREFEGDTHYTVQVAPEDCTGCNLCVEACPAKDRKDPKVKAINMLPHSEHKAREAEWFDFFLDLPEAPREKVNANSVKGSQLLQPLFEFSGACSGCGETPYLKLLTQLYGDRLAVANATGCSSIYGGNLPTTPWAAANDGRGPAWANSLFEDNAEFGLGFRLAYDAKKAYAEELLKKHAEDIGGFPVREMIGADQSDQAGINKQRERVEALKKNLFGKKEGWAKDLATLADGLIKKSIWIFGGDGWAFDIGFGGLDHVIASGHDVNILVLDTGAYSNTGGQASKATPRAAVAKFASAGKQLPRKDLAWFGMGYGNVYVARIAMGANDTQTVKAMNEAESYNGPSLLIAYSQCIEHGIDMGVGMHHQKLAVDSGFWPLLRYDPRKADQGLQLDSKAPKIAFKDYAYKEARYKRLLRSNPEEAHRLLKLAEQDVTARWKLLEGFANMH
ncbi:MAG: pyruvate:ferredoxin (flavodoxin) oxidoreductase, partial [Elusimicrobiota bacterium]